MRVEKEEIFIAMDGKKFTSRMVCHDYEEVIRRAFLDQNPTLGQFIEYLDQFPLRGGASFGTEYLTKFLADSMKKKSDAVKHLKNGGGE